MSRLVNLGPYELVERIAIGGMAEIYLAKVSGLHDFQREFVVKLIHPKYVGDSDFMRMFIDEAKLVAQLNHVNIAQVFDLGHSEDNYFIVMEYVLGRDLSEIMELARASDLPIPTSVALGIIRQILAGLYYAHSKTDDRGRSLNVVHRDITPQNILVSFFGEAKIADFGVAKAALSARPETQAGIIKGKFKYMSPEQAWGDRLDGRSDNFSAGLLLYEMLTGMNPYDGEEVDPRQTIMRMREAKIPQISHMRSDVPAELDRILSRALSRDRDERYPTALDFDIALAEVLARHDPGFSNADIVNYLQKLFPEETRRAFVPMLSHTRFSTPLDPANDPDARTIQMDGDDFGDDMTMPLDLTPDATQETVDMDKFNYPSDASISLQEIDLIEISSADEPDTRDERPLQHRQTLPTDETLEPRRTYKDRRPTYVPSQQPIIPSPMMDFATTERAKYADDDWLEVFPEAARPLIDKVSKKAAGLLNMEPKSAFVTAAILMMMLFTALTFAVVAVLVTL